MPSFGEERGLRFDRDTIRGCGGRDRISTGVIQRGSGRHVVCIRGLRWMISTPAASRFVTGSAWP
ncbi:MAG: hypothetical protein CMJ23_06165 [Phycisphaerae bacterium]|nr:hypothetical protein [Phycisphaerae bacterium]